MDTLAYFASIGVPIMEVYGMSESTGPQTVNTTSAYKIGTTGPKMPGVEMRLIKDPATNRDEICFRGRHIFMGYLGNEVKTKEAIDPQGWLHSGDVGELDSDGFLKITGRIKELLITAGGENIPPVLIEDTFKEELPIISNCCLIGDQKKFLSMLICPKVVMDPMTESPKIDSSDGSIKLDPSVIKVGESLGSTASTLGAMQKDPLWKSYIEAGRERANKRAIARAQMVQKWTLIPDFSPEKELTPTLKLKRNIVVQKYASEIEKMYA